MPRERATFLAYKPYLHIGYATLFNDEGIDHDKQLRNRSVEFDEEGKYTTENLVDIPLLREYAERTKEQYIILELNEGDTTSWQELGEKNEKSWQEYTKELEEKRQQEELTKKEDQEAVDNLLEEAIRYLGNKQTY